MTATNFGAQARRDEHRFMNVAVADERAEHFGPLVLGHGRAFEKIKRGVLVINPYRNQCHIASESN